MDKSYQLTRVKKNFGIIPPILPVIHGIYSPILLAEPSLFTMFFFLG